MTSLLWAVPALTALCCFFSLVGISLRSFRRAELERAFGGPAGRERLERLEAKLSSLRLAASLRPTRAKAAQARSSASFFGYP